MRLRIGLGLLLLVSSCSGLAAEVQKGPIKATSEYFADLAFNFCGNVVARAGSRIPEALADVGGIQITEPQALSSVGKWSEALQAHLKAKPTDEVYIAKTDASAVGAFHIAYALVDGSRCIAMAQGIPGAVDASLKRLQADRDYQLLLESAPGNLYGHAAQPERASYQVIMPNRQADNKVVSILFERAEVRPRVSDADRAAWAHALFDTCVSAAQRGATLTVGDFGEYMEERADTKDPSKKSIVAPQRFPPALLFTESRPAGCRIIVSGGAEENRKLSELWAGELRARGARPVAGKQAGQSYRLDAVRGEQQLARVAVTIAPFLSGIISLAILTD